MTKAATLTVKETDQGKWAVSDGKAYWGPFETSTEAWRWGAYYLAGPPPTTATMPAVKDWRSV